MQGLPNWFMGNEFVIVLLIPWMGWVTLRLEATLTHLKHFKPIIDRVPALETEVQVLKVKLNDSFKAN